ncbi:MAG: hypothetical protein WC775_06495 [Patescibacteria group bacterium]|jgi:hypothetical protein
MTLKKFLFTFLFLLFLPFFSSAQVSEVTSPSDTTIPIYLFLHQDSTTPIGIFAVTPFSDESFVWSYVPFEPTDDMEKLETLASDALFLFENTNVTTAGTTNYTYDSAGNVTQAGNTYYSWDYANRLSDTSNNGTTTGYIYNHAGQRVQQEVKIGTNATTTTKYWNKYYDFQNFRQTN